MFFSTLTIESNGLSMVFGSLLPLVPMVLMARDHIGRMMEWLQPALRTSGAMPRGPCSVHPEVLQSFHHEGSTTMCTHRGFSSPLRVWCLVCVFLYLPLFCIFRQMGFVDLWIWVWRIWAEGHSRDSEADSWLGGSKAFIEHICADLVHNIGKSFHCQEMAVS